MSTFSLASSCAIKADRRSGRVLSAESIMVLIFQHASLSPFPSFKASGIRHLFIDLFQPHKKLPVDRGLPTGG